MNKNIIIDEKKKKNNTLVITLIVLLVLIVGLFSCYYLFDINGLKLSLVKNSGVAELSYTNSNAEDKEGIYLVDVSGVVEEVMPSIVSITSKTLISTGRFGPSFFNQYQYAEGAGSGIIVSKNDNELLILTNDHVVEGAEELTVQFINEESVDAKIKGTSSEKDIAIISIKLSDLTKDTLSQIKIATIGDSTKLKVGNGVIAIGNALGYGQSVTTGVVSALDREVTIDNYTNKMIQIDAAINGGNSGGALLNSRGEVVGINSAKYSSRGYSSEASIEGMGFAIPISSVSDLITELMNTDKVIK